jgi:hypothetical protein
VSLVTFTAKRKPQSLNSIFLWPKIIRRFGGDREDCSLQISPIGVEADLCQIHQRVYRDVGLPKLVGSYCAAAAERGIPALRRRLQSPKAG